MKWGCVSLLKNKKTILIVRATFALDTIPGSIALKLLALESPLFRPVIVVVAHVTHSFL